MRLARAPLVGDPDNLCDLLATGVIEEYLHRDPESKVKCSVSGGKGALFVTGEYVSKADFDVSQLVQRILGTCGVYDQFEVFASLEPTSSEAVGRAKQSCQYPTVATGYATKETIGLLPMPVYLSRKIAGMLAGKREHDPDLFWLGISGDVSVLDAGNNNYEAIISVDHGNQPLDLVKQIINKQLQELNLDLIRTVKINPLGPREDSGLTSNLGRSGAPVHIYGYSLPAVFCTGSDWHQSTVYGHWLARYIARQIIQKVDSRAVKTELIFLPGDVLPSKILARNEFGKDLSKIYNYSDEFLSQLIYQWKVMGTLSDDIKSRSGLISMLPWEQ